MSKPTHSIALRLFLATCLFFTLCGCSSLKRDRSGPPDDFRIVIKGDKGIQVSGEYTLDGKMKPISGTLPIELTMNGNSIEFSLHRKKGDGPIGVDFYIDGNKSCTCSNSSSNACIEGGATGSMSWISSK